MDALTFAMNQLAGDPAAIATASVALAIGVASNSLLKAGVAFAAGSSGYRRLLTPVILLFAVLCGAGAWLTWSVFGP
jgi:hypothetical protein